MRSLVSEVRPAFLAAVALGVVTCGVYPLLVTVIARTAFPKQSSGSLLIGQDGKVIGSALIGQKFAAPQYFHPRPSAAGGGYDASSSGGSNLGPTSQQLHDAIAERIAAYRAVNTLPAEAEVPADAVTASGSGLDPHISLKNAELQASRVATARHFSLEIVRRLIAENTDHAQWGLLGGAGVNVLKVNLALDAAE